MAGASTGGEHHFTVGLVSVEVGAGGDGAPAVVKLSGELDIASASEVTAALTALLTGGHDVVVDMGGLRFCDSTGFAAFVRARNIADEQGRTFTLRRPQTNVGRAMAFAGLNDVFVIED